jgi:hypothetical protein
MAIKQIEERFNELLEDYNKSIKGGFVKGLPDNTFVDIEIGGSEGIDAFIAVTNKLLVDESPQRLNLINSRLQWTKALKSLARKVHSTGMIGNLQLPQWNKKGMNPPGMYKLLGAGTSSDRVIIRSYKKRGKAAGNDTDIRNVASQFRNELWDTWIVNNYGGNAVIGGRTMFGGSPRNAAGSSISGSRYSKSKKGFDTRALGQQFAQHTPIAHREASTTAVYALRDLEENAPSLDLNFGVTTLDIIDYVKQSLSINYNEDRRKDASGKYNIKTYVEARFEQSNTEITDIDGIKSAALEGIEKLIIANSNELLDLDLPGSKTTRQQITGDVIKDILDNAKITYQGKAVKAKITRKNKTKFDTKPKRTQTKRKAKASKNASRLAMAVSGASSLRGKRPQKDKREKVGTLQRIETLINKRLPAEVRRNMGRPALINQTGRFSNSTKVNLRETSAGISGEYTYLTSPYETFENTGSRRWPVGYNPKPLITKSIRNLALQYTAQKLVSLRRV